MLNAVAGVNNIQWCSQSKNFGGGKMFDFRRITVFCMEKRLSKHEKTIFSKYLGGPWPLWPPLAMPMTTLLTHLVVE